VHMKERSMLCLAFNYLNMNLKWIKQRGDLCWLCMEKRELEPQQFELLQDSLPARILDVSGCVDVAVNCLVILFVKILLRTLPVVACATARARPATAT